LLTAHDVLRNLPVELLNLARGESRLLEIDTVPLEKRGTLLLVVGGVVSPVHRRDEVEKGRKEVSEREGLKDDGGNTERE
jgi:hypothetical protein